jgi:hypothetical protein
MKGGEISMKVNEIEEHLLKSLRNRPDLEPNPLFIERLRHQLIHEDSRNKKSFHFPKVGIIISACLSLFIIFILASNFLDDRQPANKVDVTFNNIIESNQAFKFIYEKVVEVTEMEEQSKILIYYLEGLRTNNEEYIKSALENPEDGGELHRIKTFYHNVDFSTIKLKNINPRFEENQIELVFSLSRGEVNQSKYVFLNIKNKDDIRIDDPIAMVGWDTDKDALIAEKVAEINSKIKLGMTKDEAVEAFGENYEVEDSSDAEDGTVEDWEYHYFVEEGTKVLDMGLAVDSENIYNQNIGIQFFIGWSKEGKAQRLIMFYGQSGKLYDKGINQNGVIDERLNW